MRIAPISVIIPCYCCSQVLFRAVNSVLHQSLLPAEIILVDDASTDQGDTKRCIEEIVSSHLANCGEVRIRSQHLEHNQGPGGARNAAWDMASERYVAFLDADDSWAPRKLEIQYEWMLKNPEFTLSSHESQHIADAGRPLRHGPIRYAEIRAFSLVLKNIIPTRSVMLVNRPEFRFPPAMRYAEDYWLWLNMTMRGIRMAKIKAPLAFSYKQEYGEGGLSGNLRAMHLGVLKCYSDLRHMRLISPFVYWLGCFFENIKYSRRVAVSRLLCSSR